MKRKSYFLSLGICFNFLAVMFFWNPPATAQTITLTDPPSGALVNANTHFAWQLPSDYTKVTFNIKSQNPDGSDRTDVLTLSDGSTSIQNVTIGRNALFFHRGRQAQWWIQACHKDNPSACVVPSTSRSIKVALMALYLNKYYYNSSGTLVPNATWNNEIKPFNNAELEGRRPAFRFFNTGSESSGAHAYKIELTGGGATVSFLIPAADRVQGTINSDNSESYDVFDPNLDLVGRATYKAGYYTFEPSADLPPSMNQDSNADGKVDVYWNIMACRQIPDGSNLECGAPVANFQIRQFFMPVSAGLGALPGPGFADPGVELLQTFQHPRCLECHNMLKGGQQNDSSTVTYRHLSRVSGVNQNSSNAEIASAFSNSQNCLGCHQSNNLTDVLPAGHETDPWAWFSPLFENNLTWPDLIFSDPVAACEMIKQSVSNNAETMRHHLKSDPRVLWAFSGRTPGVTKEQAPPYDPSGPGNDQDRTAAALQEWDARVDAWVDGGMNCESATSFGTTAVNAAPPPNIDLSRDTLPPNTTVNIPGGIYNSPKTLILICDDGGGSGCSKTYYKLTEGSCGEASALGFSEYSGAITLDQEGKHCLQFYSRDKAQNSLALLEGQTDTFLSRSRITTDLKTLELGNKEDPVRQVEYDLDFKKPVTVATLLPTGDPKLVQVKLSCSDEGGSGCLITRYHIDGNITDPIFARYQEPVVIDRTQAHQFYYYSQDRAYNPENRKTLSVEALEQSGPIQQPEVQPVTEGVEVESPEDEQPATETNTDENKPGKTDEDKVQNITPEEKSTTDESAQRPSAGCQLRKF